MDGNTAATPGEGARQMGARARRNGARRNGARRNGPHTKRPDVARKFGHCPGGKDNLAADREAEPWALMLAPGVPPGDVYLTRWYRRITGSPVPGDDPAGWACVRVGST